MDIIDFKIIKEKLEDRIYQDLAISLSEFTNDTGLYVDRINISFMKVQEFGERNARTVLTDVDCEVQL